MIIKLMLRGATLVAGLLAFAHTAQAQLPPPTAADTASDPAYAAWDDGDNGGFGMGPWTLTPVSNTSQNGFFVGDSTGNNGTSGDTNNDGDINTVPGPRAWGLYANSGQAASAVRDFNLPFTPGSVFEIFMDNGDVQAGGKVGFALQNSAGQDLLEVYFVGGDTQYTVHGNTPISSGVSFTREGVQVVITLTTASTYQARLTRLVNGASSTVSGTLRANPGPISRLRLFNINAGASPSNDVFFNRITYYRGRVLNVNTGRGYLDIRPAINDPATLAGHTISVTAGLYTGTQNNNIVINKPRLTLIGAGPTATVISRTATGTQRGIEIASGITGTTISSLRVQGFNGGGICAMQGNHFTTITNTHVYSNTQVTSCPGGIYLNGSGGINHVTISHNEAVNNTSRGIVILSGFKTNITITHNLVRNNNCCGIELQNGTASGVLIAHNVVRNNFDSGIGVVGLTAGAGPNLIYSNTLINNGRFGIEIRLPSGSGLPSGDGSIVVLSNTVALTSTIGAIKPGEQRDLAGIAAYRRGWVAGNNHADIPAGVIIQGNVISGYKQPSVSDGFGIVVEGARMTVISNTLNNNDVGVQVQAGHLPYTPFSNVNGNENNLTDQYFGRGNSPVACAFYQAGNVFTGNVTNTRQVGTVTPGTVTNLNTFQTFCGIQPAIDAPPTLNGHTLSLSSDPFTGTVVVTKSLTIVGAGPGQTVISPGIVVTVSDVTISNTSIVGTGSGMGITTTLGVTKLTVSNVHVSNFAQGVALLGGHSHTVQNSVFTLTNVITSVGVGMTGQAINLPITNVLVNGNVFTSSGYAVVGIFANQNAIVGNQMRYGIAGVRLAGANGNLVAGNQIENNSSYAIYLAPDALPLIPSPVLSNSNNVISGNVALNHPNDRAIQIINSLQPGDGNQIVNNVIQNAGQEGIFTGAGSGDTNLLIAGNAVVSASAGIFVGSSVGVTVSGNTVTNTVTGLVIASSGHVSITANNLLTNSTGLSLTNSATNPVTATLNTLSGNGTGVRFNSGDAGSLLLNRNAIAGNGTGITNTAVGTLNAECNWYGAADGPSGVGSGSGDSVSTGVDFNPWLLSDDLNGPCGSGSLTIQKVLVGPITPTTAWQFTATVPTGTLVFTLPAGGGAVTFSGLDFGPAIITETPKLGYGATSSCSTGAAGGASLSFNLAGNVTCTFTNTITPATTVITLTPVANNGWFYITETVGPGNGLLPFDIVLPPPDPTLGEASARLVITNVNSRHMYFAFIFTGTRLSDITVFEYRLRVPSASPQVPYINIGWDDDVTDGNTGFRGRLVYSPPSLPADAWHIVDARNDPTPRWYTTLTGATQCTSGSPCTFAQLVAAYPNAAIHPDTFFGVPRGFIGIRVGGTGATGTGYADGLRVGVGSQITLFDFESAPPTTITLMTNPTMTVVGSNVLLTATVTISNGDPAADGTVVSFTTSLGNVSPVTATTVGGVATATLSSTVSGPATMTATVGSLSATALVTFTPGAPFSLTLSAVPDTVSVGNASTLTATATDQYGNAVADGTTISFTTNLGTLSGSTATTSGGDAVVTLTSTTLGVATVTATVSSLSATIPVTFIPGAPFTLTLTAVPDTLSVDASSTLTATATDQYGNLVANGTTISFTTNLGTLSGSTATTNGGDAVVTLTSTTPGLATVTATVGSLSATALVTFTPGAPFTLTLTAVPSTVLVGSASALTATVTDQFGNPVADGTPISFTASLGNLTQVSATTIGGLATATLSSTVYGLATVTATVSSLSATTQITFARVFNMNTGLGYVDIQPAIDDPQTLSGHTISVTAGLYTGTVVVTKSLAIVGAGPGQTVIQSPSSGIVVTASNATISNVSIVGTGSDVGITTTLGVTNLMVSNVHISNFAQGVALLRGHSHTVQNSVFTLTNAINSVGVEMIGQAIHLPITNVLISGNLFVNSGVAVAGVFAKQNAIVGNQMRYGIAGVRLAGANGNLIEGNQIENNGSYAIYLAPNAPPLVPSPVLSNSNNVISGNVVINHPFDRAIQIINSLQPGNGNQIVNNLIQNAGQAGILVGLGSGDTNLLIAGNTVIAADPGIFVGSSLTVTVSNNQVSDGSSGIRIANSSHVTVVSNTISNANDGVLVNSWSSHVTVTGNVVSSTGNAFRVANSSAVTLTANQATDSTTGFLVGSGSNAIMLSANQAQDLSTGIRVGSGATNVTLAGNAVDGTGLGLEVLNSSRVVITGNTLINSGLGFSITNSAGNLVTATFNIITGTGGVRFHSGNAGGLLLRRNHLANNVGIVNAATGVLNAECNWYGAANGPSGIAGGSGTPVSAGVDFNPWLLSDDLGGPCGGGSLTIQKVLLGPITPATAWQFTATVPTGTLAFTLPAGGGAVTFSGLDFGQVTITEAVKPGYSATSRCTTGAMGGAAISFNLIGDATCTFTNTLETPAAITLTAVPTTAVVGSNVLLTATVTISNGTPVADGTVVSFTTSLGNLVPATATTVGGVATATLSSTVSGVAMVTATVGNLSATIPVTFIPGAPFTLTLTAVPDTLSVDASSTLTATATDQYGNAVADGTTISFTTSLGALSSGTANTSGGDAVVTLTSMTPGVATVTATAGSLSATALVTFTPGAPFTVTLVAVPNTVLVGNASALTATVTDQYGNPVADGVTVSFMASLGNLVPATATTVGGVATATLSSTVSGVAMVTATVGNLSATIPVTFIPGAPFTLTLTAVPDTLSVDASSTLTATATDQYGNAVADGTTISFTTSLGALSSGTANTSGGDAVVTLTSMTPGVATVTATAGSLSATALVTFTPGAPFTVTLVAVPDTVLVGNASALTATVTDQYGNPVADGATVSFTASLGDVEPATATTAGGVATATLSSTVSGVAMVTATVGSLSATIPVTFTPDAPFTFTFTLTPTVIIANGISQSLGTVTVVDQYGNPVGGVTVNFLRAVGVFSPASGTTNANGQITTVLTSLAPAIENVFAVVNGLGFHGIQVTYVSLPTSSASLTSTLQTMTQTLGSVRKGDLITYTVTVTNTGAAQVSNVLIYAPIPNGTTYVAGSVNGGSYSNIFAMLLSGQGIDEGPLGPQAALSAVTWLGSLPGGASHTLSFAVQVQIMEGQVVNQFKVFVNNADTGMNLNGVVDVVAHKVYIPTIWRSP
jgi:parallel beta-helix repeat protein